MTRTRWAVDGPDGVAHELEGRKFSSDDKGAPMMCNFVCSLIGRHVHINYCRVEASSRCDGDDVPHINERMTPEPDKPKDATTHRLHWRRMGAYAIPIFRRPDSKHSDYGSKVTILYSSPSQALRLMSRPIHP
jgi:hypothetical protein